MTPKQRRFVDEYLIDFNATQAAIRTGYAAGSAEVTGSRLLRNAKVQAAISAAQQQQTEKLGITVEDVLSGIARLARADIRKLFDERGNLHSIHDLEDDIAAAVAAIEVVSRPVPGGQHGEIERVHKIRLWDKNAALTNLARSCSIAGRGSPRSSYRRSNRPPIRRRPWRRLLPLSYSVDTAIRQIRPVEQFFSALFAC